MFGQDRRATWLCAELVEVAELCDVASGKVRSPVALQDTSMCEYIEAIWIVDVYCLFVCVRVTVYFSCVQ